jgi:hypothetical protein
MNEIAPAWTSSSAAPWVALVLLGAFHGINPAMGWLFAVALGLQRRRRSAVLGALLPLALGHEAAIALVVLIGALAGAASPPGLLRPAAAATLIAFGAYKLLRPRSHPRWVGMRVGPWDLALWSFLMASAHGAGLMLFPILLGLGGGAAVATPVAAHAHADGQVHVHTLEATPASLGGLSGAALAQDAAAVVVHTGATLLVMAAVALLVYEKLGLAVLRRAWVNLDAVWAGAVVVAGVFTLFT